MSKIINATLVVLGIIGSFALVGALVGFMIAFGSMFIDWDFRMVPWLAVRLMTVIFTGAGVIMAFAWIIEDWKNL